MNLDPLGNMKPTKVAFFLWLNDTNPKRYFWNQNAQNWTTDYSRATMFDTRQEAEGECEYADQSTLAEVIIGKAPA